MHPKWTAKPRPMAACGAPSRLPPRPAAPAPACPVESEAQMPLAAIRAAVSLLAERLEPDAHAIGLVRLIQYQTRRVEDILATHACAPSQAEKSRR